MSYFGNDPISFAPISMVTLTLGTNDPEVGTVCRRGDESYIFVYNTGNSAIPPSYGVTISAVSGYSVTISSVTSVDVFVGVIKHATLPTAAYGWALTKGFLEIEMQADNSCAAGQALTVAADGTFALKSNSTGYPAGVVGKAMSAIASGASGLAFINLSGY